MADLRHVRSDSTSCFSTRCPVERVSMCTDRFVLSVSLKGFISAVAVVD